MHLPKVARAIILLACAGPVHAHRDGEGPADPGSAAAPLLFESAIRTPPGAAGSSTAPGPARSSTAPGPATSSTVPGPAGSPSSNPVASRPPEGDGPANPPATVADRIRRREVELLGAPLTEDASAELAMLHSPVITRALAVLGIDERERLVMFHTADRRSTWNVQSSESRIERASTVNVLSWLDVAVGAGEDASGNATAQAQVAVELVSTLFNARRAWVNAVAARADVQAATTVLESATARRDLAQRMRRAGNISALDAMRVGQSHGEAQVALTVAQAHAALERERLAHVIGLWGTDAERLQLPDRLPALPAAATGAEGLEARAIDQRWDVQRLRIAAAVQARGTTGGTTGGTLPAQGTALPGGSSTGFAAQPGVGTAAVGTSGAPHVHTWGPLSLRLDEQATRARMEVRTAWIAYRAAFDLAVHFRDTLLPVAARVADEVLKRYNGMLVSVLTLLESTSAQADVRRRTISSARDFWLADIDLQQSLAGAGDVRPTAPGRHRAVGGTDDHPATR